MVVILYFHRKYRVYSSGVLFVFWFLYSIGATLNYRTILNMVYDDVSVEIFSSNEYGSSSNANNLSLGTGI